MPTARDKYCERPDDLENLITIVEFTEQYEVFLRRETIPKSRVEGAVRDSAGRWVARRNNKIARYFNYFAKGKRTEGSGLEGSAMARRASLLLETGSGGGAVMRASICSDVMGGKERRRKSAQMAR